MKRFLRGIMAIAAAAFLVIPAPIMAAESFTVDTTHTYVMFKIDHLNIGNSYGRFDGPSGRFTWDEANPANSKFELMVQAAKIDTDSDKRDKHLRSADFFNTDQHAQISFKSTRIKKLKANTFEIRGDLTMLGQTHPITVSAVQTGSGQDPWGNYRRGFETTFTIKRSQWGMDFMLNGLSDEVEVTVSLEGVRQ